MILPVPSVERSSTATISSDTPITRNSERSVASIAFSSLRAGTTTLNTGLSPAPVTPRFTGLFRRSGILVKPRSATATRHVQPSATTQLTTRIIQPNMLKLSIVPLSVLVCASAENALYFSEPSTLGAKRAPASKIPQEITSEIRVIPNPIRKEL